MFSDITVTKSIEPIIEEENGRLTFKGEIEIVVYSSEKLKKFLMYYLSQYLNKDYKIFYVNDNILEDRKNIKIVKEIPLNIIENKNEIEEIVEEIDKELDSIINYTYMLEKLYNDLNIYSVYEYVKNNEDEKDGEKE